MATDLVCGMKVDEATAPAKATYKDKTFYFCSNTCKQAFEAKPEKYVARASVDA